MVLAAVQEKWRCAAAMKSLPSSSLQHHVHMSSILKTSGRQQKNKTILKNNKTKKLEQRLCIRTYGATATSMDLEPKTNVPRATTNAVEATQWDDASAVMHLRPSSLAESAWQPGRVAWRCTSCTGRDGVILHYCPYHYALFHHNEIETALDEAVRM